MKAGKFERDLFDLFAHAQEEREEADYGLLSVFEEEEARKIIEGAERFVRACEKYGK